MIEVVGTDEFEAWYVGLDKQDTEAVDFVVELLVARGVTLGFPHSGAIKGASFALRELRAQSGGKPLRVLYAFDARRQAVLLLGGDKTGDDRFYERMVKDCEGIWKKYLEELQSGSES